MMIPRPLVRSLAQAWAGLLRGIAAVPATPPVPWPSDLEQRLARLEAGGDPLSPEEQAARLQGEVNEKRTLQATLALVQADLAAKRQDIDRLQGELNVFRNGQRKRTWSLRFALGALGVLAVGLVISCTGFGGAFGLGMVELGDRLVGMVAPSNSGQAQAVSGLTVADPGAALTSPPPAQTLPPSPSPGPVTTCPTGMARIAATTLRLGQPIGGRQDWPRPTKSKLPPLSVAAFCIDHEPVSAAEAAAVMQSDCSAPAEALRAATCVGRDAAETWCAEHHPGGRLPSLAEWEVVARLPEAAVTDVHSLFREWVSDRFPPAVLARADPNWSKGDGMFRQPLRAQRPPLDPVGNALWGWNQQDPDNRYGNLGFRCAVTPK